MTSRKVVPPTSAATNITMTGRLVGRPQSSGRPSAERATAVLGLAPTPYRRQSTPHRLPAARCRAPSSTAGTGRHGGMACHTSSAPGRFRAPYSRSSAQLDDALNHGVGEPAGAIDSTVR